MAAPDAHPNTEAEEQRLLELARSGDRNALETLLLRYQDKIYGYGMRMCGHAADAEDVAQDTLVAAARAIGDFRGEGAFASWLYQIARSFCVKKRRRSKFAPAHEESLQQNPERFQNLPDSSGGPDEHLRRRELVAALNQAIAALPNHFREVFLLRDVEGLSTEDTAKVLGLRVATVKTRLHRARLAIRNALAPLLDTTHAATPRPPGCPDVALLLSRHLEGDLSPRVCERMERHLDRCDYCRGSCETLRQLLALCKVQPVARVPASLQQKLREALREVALPATSGLWKTRL